MPIVLAIDSATRSGWALVQGDKLLGHGVVDAGDPLRQDILARHLCATIRPDLVVIEDNFMGKNVNVVKVLSRIVGAWSALFAIRGVPSELLLAKVWQKGVLGKIAKGGTKKAAAVWVKATYGLAVSEDEADAIGMATWVSRRDAFAGKVSRCAR